VDLMTAQLLSIVVLTAMSVIWQIMLACCFVN